MDAGIVHLVGAGPGDPALMTRRSLELIALADAILYDRLIPPGALDGARDGCDLRYVGKRPGRAALQQEEIDALLVALGGRGLRVVRLKGGDPFVFGRGGEEAEALANAGIPFEVVPGVSAGVAGTAYAGIPVTHRDLASGGAFVTGHEDPAKAESALDWGALGRFPGTLVIYMGVGNLPQITERLQAAGRPADEPAVVVERATTPRQRTVTGTLETIADVVASEGVRAPAIIAIGLATAMRERIAWFERRPLHGRTVAVTRARAQASGLAERLRELGAEVVEAPTIKIEPRPIQGEVAAMADAIREYALVCITSPNGAALLLAALAGRGLDARALAGATVAAIGPGTAAELRRGGIRADVVTPRSIAESLIEALIDTPIEGRRVLVARAAEARDVLPEALRKRGADVDVIALYETVAERLDDGARAALERANYVTFTSSSTVRFLVQALSPERLLGRVGPGRRAGEYHTTSLGAESGRVGALLPEGARVVTIGPITSATAREQGLRVDVEARQHDIEGLVAALMGDVA